VQDAASLRVEPCKTNPISPGRRRVAEEIVQNKPNSAGADFALMLCR
jgi:hypothetical protein